MSEAAPPVSPAWSQRPALDLGAAARHPVSAVLQELGSTQRTFAGSGGVVDGCATG